MMCNALACNRGVVNKVGMTKHLWPAYNKPSIYSSPKC